MFSIPEKLKVVELLSPAADAAGRTSTYQTLKDAVHAWIVVHITQGNAATILLSPLQATAIAGTGSKAGPTCPVWADLDCAASDALVRATDAAIYTTDAGVKHKIVVFQIEPAALDVNGGFDCIGISTGASNAANITQALLVIETRYAQVTPPTAIVD